MMKVYPAIFHREDGSVWAEFPDLSGCQTYEETLEDCIKSAQEALGAYAASVIETGGALPEPSDITQIHTEDKNAFTTLIYCDMGKYLKDSKPVKKTLTIPGWLNEIALKENVNFSGILQDALINRLNLK